MLRRLSAEWISESSRAEDPAAEAPYQDAQAVQDQAVAFSLRDVLRGMAAR